MVAVVGVEAAEAEAAVGEVGWAKGLVEGVGCCCAVESALVLLLLGEEEALAGDLRMTVRPPTVVDGVVVCMWTVCDLMFDGLLLLALLTLHFSQRQLRQLVERRRCRRRSRHGGGFIGGEVFKLSLLHRQHQCLGRSEWRDAKRRVCTTTRAVEREGEAVNSRQQQKTSNGRIAFEPSNAS